MPNMKEIPEMTIEIYQSGKGYKDISETLGLKKTQ